PGRAARGEHDRRHCAQRRANALHRGAARPGTHLRQVPRHRHDRVRARPAPDQLVSAKIFPGDRAGGPLLGRPGARHMTEISSLPPAQPAAPIRPRDLSPVEYTEALLGRIAALDPIYHAFIVVTADIARTEARTAEAEIARGGWRGPMHGMPYALKDIFDVTGLPTTCHSKLRRNHRATADATVVRRLREAGAVLLGKLSLHEFATAG